MRVQTRSSLIAILSCSMAAPALGVPLQPVDQWSLDYGATQCTAARGFGTASAPVTLGIVPSVSGGSYALLVSEPEVGPRFAQESAGSVDFGNGPIQVGTLYFGANGVKMRVHQFRVTAAQMEQARLASGVNLRGVNGAHFEFSLSGTGSVLDALRQCTADLQRSWNVGASLGTPEKPVGDIRAIFTTNDLPPDALQKQQPDLGQYQLLIDEKGSVAGCDVLVPSGSAILDTVGCQLIRQRAKFKPAVDTVGKAVKSVWTSPRITWRTSHETFDNGCRVVNGSGSDFNACGQMGADRMIRPPPPVPMGPAPSGGSTPP